MSAILKLLILTVSMSLLQFQGMSAVIPSDASKGHIEIAEVGPDHRRIVLTDAEGNALSQYQQIQTGLMRQLEDGSWVETSTEIELFNDGAIARQTRHQVIFSPDSDDPAGVFDVLMPDGKRLRGQCIGIAYTDPGSGDSVFLGEIRSVAGELVGENEVIYRDCFAGDVRGDLRYRVTFAGLVQDVILRSKVPAPEEYGLPNDVTLEVWTEFLEAPEAARRELRRFSKQGRLVQDTSIDFGLMSIGQGKAFPAKEAADIGGPDFGRQVPVHKAYEQINGMQFLIEMVSYPDAAEHLATLPDAPQARILEKKAIQEALAQLRKEKRAIAESTSSSSSSIRLYGSKPLSLILEPKERKEGLKIARNQSKPIELAGYVLDFDLNAGTVTDFTFQSDTTYYVTGTVYLNGTTKIEGGSVIKFANTNSPQVIINTGGNLQMLTAEYNPTIFCAKDDNTVGSIISGSTGTPSGFYAYTALGYFPSTPMSLANIHFRNAFWAIYLGNGQGAVSNAVTHAQFINCGDTIVVNGTQLRIRNAVFNNCTRAFWCVNATYQCEHVTFNQLNTAFVQNWGGSTFAITNSIFCGVGTLPTISGAFNVTNNNQAELFQQVGAGKHYLAQNSPLRNAGTTQINAALATDLNRLTTYPPVQLTSSITADTTLSPVVFRDSDDPDIGYHYAPLDYLCGELNVTNATLQLTNGVAMGFYGTNGLILRDGARLFSGGRPNMLNTFVRYQLVQDDPSTALGGPKVSVMSLIKVNAPNTNPEIKFRFSRGNFLADEFATRYFVLGFNETELVANYSLESCQFVNSYHRHLSSVSTGGQGISFINNLFLRSSIVFYQTNTSGYYEFPLSFYNNTIIGAAATFYYGTSGSTWSVKDNLFDGATQWGTVGTFAASHNAYRSAAPGLGGSGNVSLTVTDYASGPLGVRYYPTTGGNLSTLINAGTRTVTTAGLFHFTTSAVGSSKDTGTVDIGFHFAAADSDGSPVDTDGDGVPDYFEDISGNGTYDSSLGETNWQISENGTTGVPGLQIFTFLE